MIIFLIYLQVLYVYYAYNNQDKYNNLDKCYRQVKKQSTHESNPYAIKEVKYVFIVLHFFTKIQNIFFILVH